MRNDAGSRILFSSRASARRVRRRTSSSGGQVQPDQGGFGRQAPRGGGPGGWPGPFGAKGCDQDHRPVRPQVSRCQPEQRVVPRRPGQPGQGRVVEVVHAGKAGDDAGERGGRHVQVQEGGAEMRRQGFGQRALAGGRRPADQDGGEPGHRVIRAPVAPGQRGGRGRAQGQRREQEGLVGVVEIRLARPGGGGRGHVRGQLLPPAAVLAVQEVAVDLAPPPRCGGGEAILPRAPVQRVGGEHGLAGHPVHAGRHHRLAAGVDGVDQARVPVPLPRVGDSGVEQRGRRLEQPGGGPGPPPG